MLIIGRNPILETLKFNPLSIKKIILINSLTDNKIKQIIKIAYENNITVEKKPKSEFEIIFNKKNKSEGISQGVAAEITGFQYAVYDNVIKKLNSKETSSLVLLDEIQDPHNLGAIIRTCSAAGVDAIIISEKNSAKVNHTVIKTSSGAINYINIILSNNIYKTIMNLKENNYKIIGTSLKSDISLYKYKFLERSAVLFGNEGEGLRKNILKLCDDLIKIPIIGKIDSLNVSVSAGVILYEMLRQKKT